MYMYLRDFLKCNVINILLFFFGIYIQECLYSVTSEIRTSLGPAIKLGFWKSYVYVYIVYLYAMFILMAKGMIYGNLTE